MYNNIQNNMIQICQQHARAYNTIISRMNVAASGRIPRRKKEYLDMTTRFRPTILLSSRYHDDDDEDNKFYC